MQTGRRVVRCGLQCQCNLVPSCASAGRRDDGLKFTDQALTDCPVGHGGSQDSGYWVQTRGSGDGSLPTGSRGKAPVGV